MIQVSKATDYALLFLTNLAQRPGRHWNVREASEELNLSRRFLANIVHQLGRRGLVNTSKGTNGGVTLLREPGTVTVREVLELFDGSPRFVECVDDHSRCDHANNCFASEFWNRLQDQLVRSLDGTTLDDLNHNT